MATKKTARSYWLLKSEPDCYGIDDLERDGRTGWDGVRNYQARNLMRDEMKVGDHALFYHSSADPTGVAGVAEIVGLARPDETALDPKNDHYDPKATKDDPIWLLVDVGFVATFPSFVTLEALRKEKRLEGMMVLARGSRLSVQPVSKDHYLTICELGGWKAK
jgi:predicted RNA-binding protein with PUA-like domain